MTPAENEEFTRQLVSAAEECVRLGYRPTKFLQMLRADGGFVTVQKLLGASKISDGFVELQMLGKLNLTVEALVIEKGWAKHFDPTLIERARGRLKAVGYSPVELAGLRAVDAPTAAADRPLPTYANGDAAVPNRLSEALLWVLGRYRSATHDAFTKHPVANFLRGSLPGLVQELVKHAAPSLTVKGSAGQGNWARGPWVGIFDPLITDTAQSGYYLCYLFREDMSGVYLSLNQGMTEAKRDYKADAKTTLAARAQSFRARLGSRIPRSSVSEIDLAAGAPTNDTAFYEAGNICAFRYEADAMPNEEQVVADLLGMVDLYRTLIEAEMETDTSLDSEDDAPASTHVEDGTRFRLHKRVERNAKLVKLVKQAKPARCEVCSVDFGERYGEIGQGYIEAHHLRPIASLKGIQAVLDPVKDFAVLCANCHRMVHKSGLIDDIERFKRDHFRP